MSRFRTQEVGGRHLVVVPTQPLSPAPASTKALGILSREEIARRRDENERARRARIVFSQPEVVTMTYVGPVVEMHFADVTPLPKNKGGRPKKE